MSTNLPNSDSPRADSKRVPRRVSLARSSLIHEWRRYTAAVLAVAFSGLLVLVQLGLLLGMFGTVSTIVDEASADMWVVASQTESFDIAREMPARIETRLRAHPGVETVQTMLYDYGDWRRADGGKVLVYVVGLDVTAQSLSMPRSFGPDLRQALRVPGAVVVDEVDLGKLGTTVGGVAEINGKRVHVVGIATGMRCIGGANVFMSMATAQHVLGSMAGDGSAYYLIRLREPARRAAVQASLQPTGGDPPYRVHSPGELSALSQLYWLLESGAGAGFGFSTVLGLMVGVAITSQTLRGAILSALREYATLRALGVSLAALRAVVLEQAFWVGLVGLMATGILTMAVWMAANAAAVAIKFPFWTFALAAGFTLSVAMLSGFLALRPLYQTEPAELLR
jgi:putative ABC transport system permease protein